jgi:hypothetical protein
MKGGIKTVAKHVYTTYNEIYKLYIQPVTFLMMKTV